MRRIAVSLLSGGVDSCVASAWAATAGYDLYLLSVNYGQVMQRELDAARRIGEILQPVQHRFVTIDGFQSISRSARTDSALIEYDTVRRDSVEIPAAYPPGRDGAFILLAAAWAESLILESPSSIEGGIVVIGTNKDDSDVFPDCRAKVYSLFNEMLAIGTKVAAQWKKRISVETPLLERTKRGVVQFGRTLNAPLELTWSCYRGGERACGRCDPCRLRRQAFRQAGEEDPIEYE